MIRALFIPLSGQFIFTVSPSITIEMLQLLLAFTAPFTASTMGGINNKAIAIKKRQVFKLSRKSTIRLIYSAHFFANDRGQQIAIVQTEG